MAAEGGARQLEVSVNGIGERAGNAALEEVVMALKCRKEILGGLYTGINTKHIVPISKMVMEYTGLHVQPHKAIVGANAFSHESGIHQDGVLKFRGTYEIISHEDIGLSQSNESIVLGKLSGRHAIKTQLLKLGYDIDGKDLDDIFMRFKEVAKTKKRVTDADIESLVTSKSIQAKAMWSLGNIQVTHGNVGFSTATVKLLSLDGREKIACAVGEGPIDASYKAINSIVQVPITIAKHVTSALEGTNAISSTRVVIYEQNNNLSVTSTEEPNFHTFSGDGADMDTVISSAQAYLNALNKLLAFNDLSAGKSSNGKV
ncbi:uncharacterized protein A4U43_C04F19550 [Asparagus officinalis]|uniref:2-isopropylmalate synthase n=1 Tax=Asparagus officinalis TaxID=4686 RepID=A0A5P1F6V2_ASPOF|nr:uncharacterized protein A4U43_C04F19550 [Asparagus officinalis]